MGDFVERGSRYRILNRADCETKPSSCPKLTESAEIKQSAPGSKNGQHINEKLCHQGWALGSRAPASQASAWALDSPTTCQNPWKYSIRTGREESQLPRHAYDDCPAFGSNSANQITLHNNISDPDHSLIAPSKLYANCGNVFLHANRAGENRVRCVEAG